MSEVVYYVATSLDGYIASCGGGIDWLKRYECAGEDYGYAAFYGSVDAVLCGRRTYEQCLSFGDWPFPGRAGWVFSRQGLGSVPPEVTVTAEDPSIVLAGLAARGQRRAWLVGGGELAGVLRERGLISEYIVSVLPVLLGEGVPLFAPGGRQEQLRLTDSKVYDNGIVQLRYVRDEAAAPRP